MKLKDIQLLIKDFEDSELTVLEFETEEVKLKLAKIDPNLLTQYNNNNNNLNTNTQVEVTDKKEQATQVIPSFSEPKLPRTAIRSPLVGTFYTASSPKSDPFVKVGDNIKVGQVVGIVEAMKIMNEIVSPFEGVVDQITIKNGDVVGFDDVIVWLKETNE